jgi:hypothetical protein
MPRGCQSAARDNDPLSLVTRMPSYEECHLAAKITRGGARSGTRLPHIISDRPLSAACARSAASAEVDGVLCGQLHVLRSRFRREDYRTDQVLRSAAGSVLLRIIILRSSLVRRGDPFRQLCAQIRQHAGR